MTNELQDKIEGKITRSFNISGVPETYWKLFDSFCKEHYGDVRWIMLKDLIGNAEQDYRLSLLYDNQASLNEKVVMIEQKVNEFTSTGSSARSNFKTFGGE